VTDTALAERDQRDLGGRKIAVYQDEQENEEKIKKDHRCASGSADPPSLRIS
jgi:hypothetical protein